MQWITSIQSVSSTGTEDHQTNFISTVAHDFEPLHSGKSQTVSTSDLNHKDVNAFNEHKLILLLHL